MINAISHAFNTVCRMILEHFVINTALNRYYRHERKYLPRGRWQL